MNRAADVAVAGFGLLVASPILAAAAVAIKLDDGGPMLYRQRRVGTGGEEFELLKLRTMVVGAETRGAGFAVNEATRITRVVVAPAPLIDELPQLWNVIRGHDVIGRGSPPGEGTRQQRRRLEVRPISPAGRQPCARPGRSGSSWTSASTPLASLDLKILARTPRALPWDVQGRHRRWTRTPG
jgi:hypothetical protein